MNGTRLNNKIISNSSREESSTHALHDKDSVILAEDVTLKVTLKNSFLKAIQNVDYLKNEMLISPGLYFLYILYTDEFLL